MKKKLSALIAGTVCLVPALAGAHIGLTTPGIANTTQELTFSVGHGCSTTDTVSVEITIPDGVTGVRAVGSADFATLSVTPGALPNSVSKVTWSKAQSQIVAGDPNFYKLTLRLKLPNSPFTTVQFPVKQTCNKPDLTGEITENWVEPESSATAPAPYVRIVPARKSGWNKYTVPVAVADVKKFFDDAQIVWKGTAAYSANTATAELIKATSGVTELTALAAGDEIWVKY